MSYICAMKTENKPNKKVKESILKDLASNDERKVLAALEATSENGDERMILLLLTLYRDADSETAKERVESMLSSLKLSAAEDVLLDALDDEEFTAIHSNILSFLWNSGFQPVDALDLITRRSLEGDYMTAVEGLTLLESINTVPDEESLYQALITIRAFLDAHKESDHELYSLALSIFEVLARFEKQ